VQVSGQVQFAGFQAVAVKGHQYRAAAKGAALIHTPAAGRGGKLPLVSQLHFAARGQMQVVQAVESARCQDTDRSAGGQALLDWQIGAVVVEH
jgi:hypothetical protein